MGKAFKLKRDTELIGAETRHGTPIDCLIESYMGETVYAYSQDPYGSIMFLIQADSWESAYGCAVDNAPTIEASEVPEAYGFDSQAELDRVVQSAEETGDYPELIEGYQYQDNASGTGIVATGHYENLFEVTPEYLRESGIIVRVGVTE